MHAPVTADPGQDYYAERMSKKCAAKLHVPEVHLPKFRVTVGSVRYGSSDCEMILTVLLHLTNTTVK